MTKRRLPAGWIHYAFWAFDHSLERARRGMFGQRPVAAGPDDLEAAVTMSGTSGKRMILRTFGWSIGAYILLSPVLVGWVWVNEWAFERGVALNTVWTVFIIGRWAIGIATALGYVAFVLKQFKASMKGLRDTRQAVLALEEMPADERSSWVDEYRREPRPGCAILEMRSPAFRALVA